ncbi:hypothetical protein [Longitalea luteola]|uniref:hypothetical protein n=1 Tax=Longitalea luteola TaxID=2812563 RepID=UPI001A96F9A1|nr:hypothetical protein [Longitalea luteola]
MGNLLINQIAVNVEVAILPYSDEMTYLKFHPNNPFIRCNLNLPHRYPGYGSEIANQPLPTRDIHWIIEEEIVISPPSLDLKKAFNCFNAVPSLGTTKYSIKLCVDVPNNDKPLLLPPTTGSETGHTFIVVTKTAGAKSITQVFGFYAIKHPGYLDPFKALPGTINNNQLREINASIEMDLTEKQFETNN